MKKSLLGILALSTIITAGDRIITAKELIDTADMYSNYISADGQCHSVKDRFEYGCMHGLGKPCQNSKDAVLIFTRFVDNDFKSIKIREEAFVEIEFGGNKAKGFYHFFRNKEACEILTKK